MTRKRLDKVSEKSDTYFNRQKSEKYGQNMRKIYLYNSQKSCTFGHLPLLVRRLTRKFPRKYVRVLPGIRKFKELFCHSCAVPIMDSPRVCVYRIYAIRIVLRLFIIAE